MDPSLTSMSKSNNCSIICGSENLENTNYTVSRIPAKKNTSLFPPTACSPSLTA
ncbi:hypothetical protein I79_007192 [Cricetulus griseus]|uniref:Uncharacterized protein n=1 Tax=Cricetulus griseus TaxID=10029 RepID=G3H9W1_CRIGR|nr:hypothetical protein I79_007192 [Cricetulus griseus]